MSNRSIAILSVIIVICFGILFYFIHFFHFALSDDTKDWGSFGTYINVFVTTSNLIILIWFSNLLNNYNKAKDTQETEFKKTIERPILIFSNTGYPGETWLVKNIGKGAALNLLLFEAPDRGGTW